MESSKKIVVRVETFLVILDVTDPTAPSILNVAQISSLDGFIYQAESAKGGDYLFIFIFEDDDY